VNLGFVGVGPHAEKLARVLTELGAKVVCHDRASDAPGPDWAGKRVPWRDMLTAGLDGIVAVATPQVTAEVVKACLDAVPDTVRFLSTKPLLWEPELGDYYGGNYYSSRAYVDLWRLWSPSWRAFRDDIRGRTDIESVNVVCVGNGPDRGYSGVLDYGSHAMAFVHDLMGTEQAEWRGRVERLNKREQLYAVATIGSASVTVNTGNAANAKQVHVTARAGGVDYRWWEFSEEQAYAPLVAPLRYKLVMNHRDVALRAFCRSFLNGEPNDSFRLSTMGYRVLREFDV
jgi:hypothetical protein